MSRFSCGILGILVLGASVTEAQTAEYLDTQLSFEERASDLVHRMTLQEKASQLVNQARAIQRLGVPAYDWWSESLHGVARDGTTEFPEPVGLAATFDPAAIHEMVHTIGIEGRIKHAKAEAEGHSNIFEGLEEKQDAKKDAFDIMALGEKVRLAKSANIDAMAFLEKCHDRGLTIPESLAALDAEVAKTAPAPDSALGAAKS